MNKKNTDKNKRPVHLSCHKETKKKCLGGIGEKKPCCHLVAKDSEWIDIVKTKGNESTSKGYNADGENVLNKVDCESDSQIKPMALMFPSLLEQDPIILEDMLNKAMSTTEVTKHLVGQKPNFSFMKRVNRLIPTDKRWLESLSEDNNSNTSKFEIDGFSDSSEDEQSSAIL